MNIYKEIVENTPFGVMILDANDNIITMNQHGLNLLRYNDIEIRGHHVNDFFHNGTVTTGENYCVEVKLTFNDLPTGQKFATFYNPADFSAKCQLTDALTRVQFFNAIKRIKDDYSVLFIDLNKFKQVNDTLGHQAGDFVLTTVSKRIQNVLRATDLFCRYGGDEFVIVVPGKEKAGRAVYDKVRFLVEEPMRFRDRDLEISCSVGIALSTESKDINELILAADQRMYIEKDENTHC